MSCHNFEGCHKDELERMQYPIDSESLYSNRYYDEQTANNRCYAKGPIEILEGFGFGFSLTNLIKIAVVILLIYLAYSLSKDFLFPKQVVSLDISSPGPISTVQPPSITKQ